MHNDNTGVARKAKQAAAKARAKRLAKEAAAKARAERLAKEAAAKVEAKRRTKEAAAKAEAERKAKEAAAAKAEVEQNAKKAVKHVKKSCLLDEPNFKTIPTKQVRVCVVDCDCWCFFYVQKHAEF